MKQRFPLDMNVDFFIFIRKRQRQRNAVEIAALFLHTILRTNCKIQLVNYAVLLAKYPFYNFQFLQCEWAMIFCHDIQLHDTLLTGNSQYIITFIDTLLRNIINTRRKHSLHIIFSKRMNTAIRFSQHRSIITFTKFDTV